MRFRAGCCALAITLSACSSGDVLRPNIDPRLPLNVENGIGSERGNYEMRPAGETRDAAGNRCVVFNWDRPLNRAYVIRYSSASCESKEHPVRMHATPYTRTIIPISESNLKSEQSPNAQSETPASVN